MTELSDVGAEVRRLLNAVFDGTEVEIVSVSYNRLGKTKFRTLQYQYRAAGVETTTRVTASRPADPIEEACRLANYLQDDVVYEHLWAQPVPPCGVHDHHPANIEVEGPAGLRLECPYGDWSREIR